MLVPVCASVPPSMFSRPNLNSNPDPNPQVGLACLRQCEPSTLHVLKAVNRGWQTLMMEPTRPGACAVLMLNIPGPYVIFPWQMAIAYSAGDLQPGGGSGGGW